MGIGVRFISFNSQNRLFSLCFDVAPNSVLVYMNDSFHNGASSWFAGLKGGRLCPLSNGLGKAGKGQGTGIGAGAGVGVFIILLSQV
jgi:hypothetical protein